MTDRVLVTGGSGFVGTNVIEHVREAGHEVRNLDVAPPRNPAHRDAWSRIDLLDRDALIAEVNRLQPDVVLHLAARTDLRERRHLGGYAANIDGVLNLVDAIRAAGSARRLVVASTQLVCPLGYVPRDELDVQPATLYGRSKVVTEQIIRSAGAFVPTWTIVRPTSLWGPWFGVPLRPLFELIERKRYVHPAGVSVRKQWGFIGNVVFQLKALLDAPPAQVHGRTFYVSDYEPVDLGEFTDRVARTFGEGPVRRVPRMALRAAATLGDVARAVGWRDPPLSTFRYRNMVTDELQDVAPVRAIAGPLPYDLDEGIALTVRWLRDQARTSRR